MVAIIQMGIRWQGVATVTWLLSGIQCGLAVVFLAAAAGKALRREEFEAALRLTGAPFVPTRILGFAVPAAEASVALALLLAHGTALVAVMALAAGVLVSFTAWLVWILARRRHVRCGCFGSSGDVVRPRTVARNGAFLALAGAGLALAAVSETRLPGPSFFEIVTVTTAAATGGVVLAVVSARAHLFLTVGKVLRVLDELRTAQAQSA
jgi:hypothetical protein